MSGLNKFKSDLILSKVYLKWFNPKVNCLNPELNRFKSGLTGFKLEMNRFKSGLNPPCRAMGGIIVWQNPFARQGRCFP